MEQVFLCPTTSKCLFSIDTAIGDIQRACEEAGYVMLVTADHGNAERMIDEEGKPVTKHTTYRGTHTHTQEEALIISRVTFWEGRPP